MPKTEDPHDALVRLQLHDLRERRRNVAERRWLWFIVALIFIAILKWHGVI